MRRLIGEYERAFLKKLGHWSVEAPTNCGAGKVITLANDARGAASSASWGHP
jgi:hypothetical protein